MDKPQFKDGRVHFRNSRVKELNNNSKKNQSSKGTEMTDLYQKFIKKKFLICIKPLQEERLTALWMGLSERLTKGKPAGVRYFKGQIFENSSNKKISNLFKNVVLQIQLSTAYSCIYI